MQAGIFKVCLVLLTAIVNHPLLFPNEDIDLPVSDELIIQKMKVYEEKLKFNQLQLEQLLSHAETNKNAETEITEDDPPWHFWSVMPMIILLMIEIWRQVFQDGNSPEQSKEEKDLQFLRNSCQSVALPNNLALAIFSDQYFRLDTYDATRTREFVEDFTKHLLETLRSVCNRDADMEVKDSICVGSMYENWRVNKPFVCDLIVPFVPPEPYHFRCQSWVTNNCIPPGCGIIRVAGPDDESVGCVCDKTKLGEDMFCPLHNPKNKTKVNNEVDLLCSKTTHSLDTDQVMKWFQTAVTKFWTKVSHIYNFDISFSHLECPGALRVKCKSGKVINFNITPVVQYEDSDLYFLSHLPRSTIPGVSSNIHWFLSFAVYERRFLKDIAKSLPEDSCHLSCLQIMTFLHSKQCHITGQSGLTSYHLKTVLLHLLLTRSSSDWDNMMLEERLHDMFKSLEKCLLEKRMHHFMVGNSKLPESVNLPDHFRLAEPLNLFHPFVLNKKLYQKTLSMFYEMLKNATLLINEYILNFRPTHANKNHINITTV